MEEVEKSRRDKEEGEGVHREVQDALNSQRLVHVKETNINHDFSFNSGGVEAVFILK